MSSAGVWVRWTSLAASLAAYAAGVALSVGVTAYGLHRVATAVSGALPSRTAPSVPHMSRRLSVTREAAMTPTSDRWPRDALRIGPPSSGSMLRRIASSAQFGSSSRSPFRMRDYSDRDDDEDEDERPRYGNTYRTLCVRLCDGFYFPVSFSVTPERFERDRQVCETSCGSEARLFVYRNPGGDIEDMTDLQGRPYRALRTAFLYRTEYVPSCKCQPHPWEAEAKDRHRAYALAAAKKKGDRQAARELEALEARLRQDERARTDSLPATSEAAPSLESAGPRALRPEAEASARKRARPQTSDAASDRNAEWKKPFLRP